MASNYTEHYGLCQWEATDQVLREEFNEGYTKIDAALKAQADDLEAEVSARKEGDNAAAEANCFVKLLDLSLEADTPKWDIDMSGIDLTKYQKLMIYPHLAGNTNQWVYMHINGLTSGYYGPGNNTNHCGNVPMNNVLSRQNFGVCEYTMLIELPKLFIVRTGVSSGGSTAMPSVAGYNCPELGSGITHLDTLNFWFDMPTYQIHSGSSIQIYGLTR